VPEELVWMLSFNAAWREDFGWEILEVVGDDQIGASDDGGGGL